MIYAKGAIGKCNDLFEFVDGVMKEHVGLVYKVQPSHTASTQALVQLHHSTATGEIFKLPQSFSKRGAAELA